MRSAKIKPVNKIVMMEDHDKAYYVWKESDVKDKILVHIDAHIDFNLIPDMDLKGILDINDSKNLNYLLEHQPIWNPFIIERNKMLNIGNYIFPALKENMIKSFYWVIPDPSWESKKGLKYIKKTIQQLLKIKRYVNKDLEINKDYLYCRIFNKDIFICSLSNLSQIDEPILLDIDVDFLLTKFVWDGTNPKRTPWILPEQLIEKLSSKIKAIDILTIAYSVEGGFTPLKYKYLGDKLRFLFEGKLDRQIDNASSYYNLALLYLNNGKIDLASHFYKDAVLLDPTYKTSYNNDGIIYEELGKLKQAKKSYKRFLSLDSKNISVLNGLGRISLKEKKFNEAEQYFNQSLQINQDSIDSILGLGIVYFKTGRLKDAGDLFFKAQTIKQDEPLIYLWLGKLFDKNKETDKAIEFYKQASMLGFISLYIHFRLFLLYLKKNFYYCAWQEMKRTIKIFIGSRRL